MDIGEGRSKNKDMRQRAIQQTRHFITKACSKGRKQCLST